MILTARIYAGFNAASVLAGLLALTDQSSGTASAYLAHLFPGAQARARLDAVSVSGIGGFRATIEVDDPHPHRTPADIATYYDESRLTDAARALVDATWAHLARAEARVHDMPVESVHFHEVGRLANVYAVGLAAQLFVNLAPEAFVLSPLPMSEGEIRCAHGTIPYPAPALCGLLEGVAVRGWEGVGEAVTPTGLALALGLGCTFGPWPEMTVERTARVYTAGRFENTAQGTLFALGSAL